MHIVVVWSIPRVHQNQPFCSLPHAPLTTPAERFHPTRAMTLSTCVTCLLVCFLYVGSLRLSSLFFSVFFLFLGVLQWLSVQGWRVHPGQLSGHQRDRVASLFHVSRPRVPPTGWLPRRSGESNVLYQPPPPLPNVSFPPYKPYLVTAATLSSRRHRTHFVWA